MLSDSCHRVQSCLHRVMDNLQRHLQKGWPINKERGNLFAIPSTNLEVQIEIQAAIVSFKNYERFIF
jgi:hypothetical protein